MTTEKSRSSNPTQQQQLCIITLYTDTFSLFQALKNQFCAHSTMIIHGNAGFCIPLHYGHVNFQKLQATNFSFATSKHKNVHKAYLNSLRYIKDETTWRVKVNRELPSAITPNTIFMKFLGPQCILWRSQMQTFSSALNIPSSQCMQWTYLT